MSMEGNYGGCEERWCSGEVRNWEEERVRVGWMKRSKTREDKGWMTCILRGVGENGGGG